MPMNKNLRSVLLALICAALVAVVIYAWIQREKTAQILIDCGPQEGKRYRIDISQFATQYVGHTLSIEGEIKDKAKFGAKLGESQFQELSESLQQNNAFMKSLVAGYNACAVPKTAYNQAITRYKDIDEVARELDGYLKKDSLSDSESAQLSKLVDRYVALTNTEK